MHFFATADGADEDLDPNEFIDDYGALALRLVITYRWSSDEETDRE